MSTHSLMPQSNSSLVVAMAQKFGLQPEKFLATLKATVFPHGRNDPEPSNEQMAVFLTVAKQYELNPFIKEIYAFPSKAGIVPIVSVDGWCSLINRQPQMDGIEFEDHLDSNGKLSAITCKIYRKDRTHPTVVTEYMEECRQVKYDDSPWVKWPSRMLRHKALIQAGRYAFGLSGIYDPDEAERIREGDSTRVVEYEHSERSAVISQAVAKATGRAQDAQQSPKGTKPSPESEKASETNVPQRTISDSTNAYNGIQGNVPREGMQPMQEAPSEGGESALLPPVSQPEDEAVEAVAPIRQEVIVRDLELRNRKGDKGQWILLTCEIPGMPGDLALQYWHKTQFEEIKTCMGKNCDFGLKRHESAKDAVTYTIEAIYRIGDKILMS